MVFVTILRLSIVCTLKLVISIPLQRILEFVISHYLITIAKARAFWIAMGMEFAMV